MSQRECLETYVETAYQHVHQLRPRGCVSVELALGILTCTKQGVSAYLCHKDLSKSFCMNNKSLVELHNTAQGVLWLRSNADSGIRFNYHRLQYVPAASGGITERAGGRNVDTA